MRQVNPAAVASLKFAVINRQESVPAPQAVNAVAHTDTALNVVVPEKFSCRHLARKAAHGKARRVHVSGAFGAAR